MYDMAWVGNQLKEYAIVLALWIEGGRNGKKSGEDEVTTAIQSRGGAEMRGEVHKGVEGRRKVRRWIFHVFLRW